MMLRKGAPLWVALVGMFFTVQYAAASHCGATQYSGCCQTSGEAQCSYSDCQQQHRACYKLVYDNVMEKRWHT